MPDWIGALVRVRLACPSSTSEAFRRGRRTEMERKCVPALCCLRPLSGACSPEGSGAYMAVTSLGPLCCVHKLINIHDHTLSKLVRNIRHFSTCSSPSCPWQCWHSNLHRYTRAISTLTLHPIPTSAAGRSSELKGEKSLTGTIVNFPIIGTPSSQV